MKMHVLMVTVVSVVTMMSATSFAAGVSSEALFKDKCAACHPDGGNIMKPGATIKGMKNSAKIVTQIRKGGGGMPAFDAKTISNADAKKLAGYIIKTFK